MKHLALLLILICTIPAFCQVEINPTSVNAELRINSTTKGVLLPRVNNPTVVNSPVEGLLIYDKATKTPSFHNGTQWNTLAVNNAVAANNPDVITYTITNAAGGFTNGTYNLDFLSVSGSSGFPASFSIGKPADINSIAFLTAGVFGKKPATATMVMEVKIYHLGSVNPYYSVKFTDILVLSYQFGFPSSTNNQETYVVQAITYGFKDWVNNISFGVDSSGGITTY